MDPTLVTPQLAVYDEVLPRADFDRLASYIEGEDYAHVHAAGLKDVWRPEDGLPLSRRKPFVWSSVALAMLASGAEAQRALREHADFHPTNGPVDAVLEAVRGRAAAHPDLVGEQGRAWLGMSAKIYVYPAGTGLSWHDDAGHYTGSFVYYAHPAWSAQWGGELLVADPASAQAFAEAVGEPRRAAGRRKPQHHFGAKDAGDEALMTRGLGQFVAPRPNRLVLLAGEQPHMLARVSAAAGNHCRLSVAGFFLTPGGLVGLTQALGRPT
jgi:2OG-Fe(II) oxygenase superfamily